jgi:(p)ppGpp synthase/HD superfamily hydrolase
MNSPDRLHNMTLAEILPAARRLSASEKLKLIRILAEDLEITENIAPLEPFKTYDLSTPYDCFGAGAVLMEALKQSDASQQ